MAEGAQEGAEPEGPVPLRRKASPSSPPPLSKAARAFADKARDLDALRTTVVDATGVGAGLWFSYLFVLLYLFVAVGSVTHKDLFLKSPIRLPFLNIELPLLGFFALGPLLFLVVHGYVLLHFVLLAGKVGAFHAELKQLDTPPEMHEDLRRQLPSNLFVQILAGPREVRGGSVGFLLRLVAQFSLVFGPVALLAFFLLQFLPYHHEWITEWHRIALVVDLALIWLLWPSVAGGGVRLRGLRSLTAAAMAVASLFVAVSAFTVATFPGERLHAWRSLLQVPAGRDEKGEWAWASLHSWLIDGKIDHDARAPISLWSNRLVLPDFDLINHAKLEMPSKLSALPEAVSLRKRDLRGAVLTGAKLGKVDLTAAQLQDASLDRALLRGASLERAQLQGASLFEVHLEGAWIGKVNLQGAKLIKAQLQGANLFEAQLQGASLDEAQFQRALMIGAQLQSASLDKAQLQGATLDFAELQGASLDQAQLQGASLVGAQLQGASLIEAQLQGAWLGTAQLEGALLHGAKLQGASLDAAHLWGASLKFAQLQGASLKFAQLQGATLDFAQLQGATLDFAELQGVTLDGSHLDGASFIETQLQSASLEAVTVWRSDPRTVRTGLTRVVQTHRLEISSDSFQEIWRVINDELPDGKNKIRALRQIEALNEDMKPKDQDIIEKAWVDLESASPPLDVFMESLVEQWRRIGCIAPGSPYVLRQLIWKLENDPVPLMFKLRPRKVRSRDDIALRNKHFATLAADFLRDDCDGAKSLTDEDRATLRSRPWEKVKP